MCDQTNPSVGILPQDVPEDQIRKIEEWGLDRLVTTQRVLGDIIRTSLVSQERPTISSPQDVADLTADMATLEQEHLRLLLLNTRNQVLSIQNIYVGTVKGAEVRISEVLRPAIRANATSIIVVHNHPSGDPTPSKDDVSITKDLVAAGKLMGIELLDHLVIGECGRYVSMEEKGLGFDRPTPRRKKGLPASAPNRRRKPVTDS